MSATPGQGAAVRIRPARRNDERYVIEQTERLAAFGPPPWRTASEIAGGEARTLQRFFRKPPRGTTLLIAESVAGQQMGFVYLETAADYFTGAEHGHVGVLVVSAEGRGVAGALLRSADEWARQQQFTTITLNVFEANRHARAVYEHLGYLPETLRYVKRL